MDESLDSDDEGRVHIHEQRELCREIDETGLGSFTHGNMAGYDIKPNVSKNYLEAVGNADAADKGRGPAYRASYDHAHFLCRPTKYGTLFAKTDWVMQKKFKVNAKWFDDLVARGKISRDEWSTRRMGWLDLRRASAMQIRWRSMRRTKPFSWTLLL